MTQDNLTVCQNCSLDIRLSCKRMQRGQSTLLKFCLHSL